MPGYPSLWRRHLHGNLGIELCCRGSEMQSSADGAGSDMRGLHVEGIVSATPELISLLFQMRWEVMGSLVPKSVSGWWEGSEWDLSLSLAPRPQFLSSVLWLKTRWEPQKTLFREGNCRWQKCVKQMCTRGSLQLMQEMVPSSSFPATFPGPCLPLRRLRSKPGRSGEG